MKDNANLDKKPQSTAKPSRRFATPEEVALAKNANLITHIKKLGLKIEKLSAPPK